MPSKIFIDAINNVSPETEERVLLYVKHMVRLSQLIEQKKMKSKDQK
jgi:hypothetical protein